jgi:hypothetical protein
VPLGQKTALCIRGWQHSALLIAHFYFFLFTFYFPAGLHALRADIPKAVVTPCRQSENGGWHTRPAGDVCFDVWFLAAFCCAKPGFPLQFA